MKPVKRQLNMQKGEAILNAATHLFLKHGYAETSMDAIALKAKVTKQTVYSHYRSKDMLFTRMIDHLCRRSLQGPSKREKSKAPIEQQLYDVGMNLLMLITSPEGMAATRLVIAEAGRLPKIARMYYENGTQRITQLIAEFLDEQNERGVLAIKDTPSAAAYFFTLLKGQYFLRMTLGVPPIPTMAEREEYVRETVAIFLRIYGGKTPLHTRSRI